MKTKNEKDIERFLNKSIKFKRELKKSSINVALYNALIGKINSIIDLLT